MAAFYHDRLRVRPCLLHSIVLVLFRPMCLPAAVALLSRRSSGRQARIGEEAVELHDGHPSSLVRRLNRVDPSFRALHLSLERFRLMYIMLRTLDNMTLKRLQRAMPMPWRPIKRRW